MASDICLARPLGAFQALGAEFVKHGGAKGKGRTRRSSPKVSCWLRKQI